MGLKDILTWWSRRADQEALERERETELAPETRSTAGDGFDAHKVDSAIHQTRSGAEAEQASAGDLEDV
jgi:hypothetical protein